MRICIVGGIFDKPADYRVQHSISPETVLADGLRQRGWQVTLGRTFRRAAARRLSISCMCITLAGRRCAWRPPPGGRRLSSPPTIHLP